MYGYSIWRAEPAHASRSAGPRVPGVVGGRKTIFYASNPKGTSHMYSKAADGSGTERIVLETAEPLNSPPCLSGRPLSGLLQAAKNEPGRHLWALPLFGDGKPFPVVQNTFEKVPRSLTGREMDGLSVE